MATPEEIAAMRDRLNAVPSTGTDNTPLGQRDEMVSRLRNYAVPFAMNPAVRALGTTGNPMAAPMNHAMDYAGEQMGLGRRNPTSFLREEEGGPQHVDLQPMASQDVAVPGVAPLQARPSVANGLGASMGAGSGGMGGLASAYHRAQQNQFGTLNEQQDLVERRGELQGEHIDKAATLQELNAARKQRDVEVLAEHNAKVQEKHDAFLARNQELADQIGEEKISPQKVIDDMPTGQKIGMLIAGMLSGAAGQGPAALARMDGLVEQGVRAQMANAEGKKAKLAARQNLFGQMMAESGDRRVAETQTKQLIWQAIDQDLAARSSRLAIPEVQNAADLQRNQIVDTRINPLQVQLTGEALKAAQAQAAATAAAQRAAEEKAWQRGMDVAKLGQEGDKIAIERAKLDAENPQGGGLGKTGRDAMALEQAKTQQILDATQRSISAADPAAVAKGGEGGSAASHLPTWVPGVTGAREDVNAREAYNSLVRPGVGAAWKMRTGGVEPKNPTILEEQAKAFMVQPSDNEATVKDRMARFRKHMNEAADAQGAAPMAQPSTVKFREALDKK